MPLPSVLQFGLGLPVDYVLAVTFSTVGSGTPLAQPLRSALHPTIQNPHQLPVLHPEAKRGREGEGGVRRARGGRGRDRARGLQLAVSAL